MSKLLTSLSNRRGAQEVGAADVGRVVPVLVADEAADAEVVVAERHPAEIALRIADGAAA